MNIIVYFFIGGISFIGNFGVFIVFVNILGQHWIVGNIAGFVAGTLINYVLSIRFVFESRNFFRRRTEVFLTVIVSAVGVGMETLLIYLAHEVAGFGLNAAKLGAAGVVFFWNYGARRFLVFGAVKTSGGPRSGDAAGVSGRRTGEGTSRRDGDGQRRPQKMPQQDG